MPFYWIQQKQNNHKFVPRALKVFYFGIVYNIFNKNVEINKNAFSFKNIET